MKRFHPLAVSIATLLPFLTSLVAPPPTNAQTWNGGSGDWGSAANWTPGTVPNTWESTAVFAAATSPSTVSLGGTIYSINSLVVQGGGTAPVELTNGMLYFASSPGGTTSLTVGPRGTANQTLIFGAGATLHVNNPLTINTLDPSSVIEFTSAANGFSGSQLTKTGAGVLRLGSASQVSMILQEGRIEVSHNHALGQESAFRFANGSTAELRSIASVTLSNVIFIGDNATATISAAPDTTLRLESGTIGFGAEANLVFQGAAGSVIEVAHGSSSGVTGQFGTVTIAEGTVVRAESSGGLGGLTSLTDKTTVLAGALLDYNDKVARVTNLQGTGTVHMGVNPNTQLTIKGGDFSGLISGGGTLVVDGSLILSGVGTYSGGTRLNTGVLLLGSNDALGGGTLTIGANTGLGFASNITLANNISITGDFRLLATGETSSVNLTGNIDVGNSSRTIMLQGAENGTRFAMNGEITGLAGLDVVDTSQGAATLVLGGSTGNTFTGRVAVYEGTTVEFAKSSGFAAPNRASVEDGGHLVINNPNQQIRGSLFLAGTLDIEGSQAIDILEGTGTIRLSTQPPAELTIRAGIFPGSITQVSGVTSLVKDDQTQLTLTGVNTYAGETFIRGGTLAVNSDAALGQAGNRVTVDTSNFELLEGASINRPITINNVAGIVVNGSPGALTGVISGQGLLIKRGDGTLRLSGVNTYTAGTSIEQGTLEIFSDSNLGAAGGYLYFYGGTLKLLGDWTSSRSGVISSGATIDTNGFNATFSGDFSGEGGGLTKIGAGTLTITTAQSFFGDTFVRGGTLILNGSVARDVIVGEGPGREEEPPARVARKPRAAQESWSVADRNVVDLDVNLRSTVVAKASVSAAAAANAPVFGGSGQVRGSLFNYGIVSPGNSPGTLTVDGDFTQGAGGTLRIEIAGRESGQYDKLVIGGAANLNGAVQFISLDDFRPVRGDRFEFLTAAGGVNGRFLSVLTAAPLIAGRVEYLSDSVALTFSRRPIAPIFNGGGEVEVVDPPELPHLTTNQTAVVHVLDDAINDERLDPVFREIDRYSLPGIPGAIDLIAPEELSAIYEIGIGYSRVQAFNLDRHLSDVRRGRSGFSSDRFRLEASSERSGKTILTPDGKAQRDGKDVFVAAPENRWSVFLSGSGEFLDIDSDHDADGYEITTSGFTLGADYRVSEGFAVGILAGYAGTGTDLVNDGHILVNSGKLGIYATAFSENWYVNALAAGGYNSYDVKRRGLGGTTRGETEGGEFTGLLTAGYDVQNGRLTWGPFVEAQYTYVGYNGFEERGSAAPLDIQSNDSDSLRTRLGARLAYQCNAGSLGIIPEVRLSWQHEYLDRTRPTDSRFASGAGDVFRVEGPEVGRDSLIVNASVSFVCSDLFSTYLAYDGELGRRRYESHTVSGGVSIGF